MKFLCDACYFRKWNIRVNVLKEKILKVMFGVYKLNSRNSNWENCRLIQNGLSVSDFYENWKIQICLKEASSKVTRVLKSIINVSKLAITSMYAQSKGLETCLFIHYITAEQ